MADIPATVMTVSGTATAFLPLPTPWPSGYGCAANIYLHTPVGNPLTFLAWDPLFGANMVPSARSCLPPQVTSWWSQPSSGTMYTALGPAFACPEAYSAVQTVLVASSLSQTFCCPSQYSLLVPQPNRPKAFPSQCISTVTSGQLMTYLSNQAQTDAFTATITMNSTATIFGIPVNGFNIPANSAPSTRSSTGRGASLSSSTSATSSSSAAATPAQSGTSADGSTSSPTLAKTVGISVGLTLALLIVLAFGYMMWKRRRRETRILPGPGRRISATAPGDGYTVGQEFAGIQPSGSPSELSSVQHKVYELSAGSS